MKRKILLSLVAVAFSSAMLNAQNMFDALRYSQNYYTGTARFTSMAGAFSALGGDFSTLSVNPAGVGVYRSWEFTLTPAVSYAKTLSSYEDTKDVSDSYTRFGFANLGYVMPVYMSGKEHGLTNLNFAVGYNKLNNFNSNTSAMANATNKSLLWSFADQAYNNFGYYTPAKLDNNPFNSGEYGVGDWPVIESWETYLLDNNFLPVAALSTTDLQRQYLQTETRGSLGEYVFSFGGNISHKLYFGMTLGLQDVMYEMNSYYEEQILTSSTPTDLNSFGYNRYYNTDGVGVNLKFGAIYRPIDDLRLAFAVHTPTWYNLTDTYYSSMWSKFNTPGTDGRMTYTSDPYYDNVFDYRINTPYKLVGGIAYTLKTYGLISLDYEFVDYSTMKMKDTRDYRYQNSFSEENKQIKDYFKGASNIRVGLEGNIGMGFALRAGYGYYGSPYKADDFSDNFTSVYSAGVGYRFNGGFIDFAYSRTNYNTQYSIEDYIPDDGQMMVVDTKNRFNQFLLTLGLKF